MFGGLGTRLGTLGAGLGTGGGSQPSIPTTVQSSYVENGRTITLREPRSVGVFEDGSHFIVSDQPIAFKTDLPSAVENGGWAHGMMLDPYHATQQAWDEFIASGNASADVPYLHSLNVDPGAAGTEWLEIPAGAKRSYVKSNRVSGMTSADGRWQTIEKYAVITILPVAPPAGSYRPGVASLSKVMLNKNSFNPAASRSISLPASFTDTTAQVLAKVPDYVALMGQSSGERARRMRTDVALGTTTSNYSRDIAPFYAELIAQMHRSGISNTDRDAVLRVIALHASDVAGLSERGYFGPAQRGTGAGQSGAIEPMLWAAAFFFNSSYMLDIARQFNTLMLANGIWISNADVGIAAPGNATRTGQTYLPEMVGSPWIVVDDETSEPSGRYVPVASAVMAFEVPVTALHQNGPGGLDGFAAMLNGPNDTTNQKAATPAFLSQWRRWSPNILLADNPTTKAKDLIDLVVSLIPSFAWTGKPQQVPYGTVAPYLDNWFTGGDGSISWDISALDFSTTAITRRDIRYSLDKRTWVQVDNVAASGTISSLLKGVPHFVNMRRHSAAGASDWSSNHPLDKPLTGTPRGRPSTTGTLSNAAPVNTVAPKIVRQAYPLWGYEMWEDAPSPIAASDRLLSAGVGYYTGYPAPTYAFQWKRDGVAIAGETGQNYTRQFVDGGSTLTCDVTATNSSGSVTTTTAGVSVPANASPDWVRTDNNATGYLTRAAAFSGSPSGKALTFAFKGKMQALDGALRVLLRQATSSQPFQMDIQTTNALRIQARNAAGTVIGRVDSATGAITVAAGELTVVGSFDLATGAAHLYVNGVSSRSGTDILTNDTINWSATSTLSLLATPTGTGPTDAEMDYIFFDDAYLDLSVSGNRNKFGVSADMLPDGSGPLGRIPLVYMTGPAADLNAGYGNRGRGGPFLLAAGAFT